MDWKKVNEVNPVDVAEMIQPGYRTIGSSYNKRRNPSGPIQNIDKLTEDWLSGRDIDDYFKF